MDTQQDRARIEAVTDALSEAAIAIYKRLRTGADLGFAGGENASGDDQIELDLWADKAFLDALTPLGDVRYVISEERPDLVEAGQGPYSIALDPIDGSKSAQVGIPCGSIFGIFKDAADHTDFDGAHIIASGFFLYGITLELFATRPGGGVVRKVWAEAENAWEEAPLPAALGAKDVISVNSAYSRVWPEWMQRHYGEMLTPGEGRAKPVNVRWYASMVADVKRLLLQGGLFAYPENSLPGQGEGKLRLVYEAVPMAHLVRAMGGASSDGRGSLLERPVTDVHQTVPVYLGEKSKIAALEAAAAAS